ncbi:MAG: hypothetical protein NVS1B10_06370 [Candidatus Saccharimonadales bacterium]
MINASIDAEEIKMKNLKYQIQVWGSLALLLGVTVLAMSQAFASPALIQAVLR